MYLSPHTVRLGEVAFIKTSTRSRRELVSSVGGS
jgi:hypothetical protein